MGVGRLRGGRPHRPPRRAGGAAQGRAHHAGGDAGSRRGQDPPHVLLHRAHLGPGPPRRAARVADGGDALPRRHHHRERRHREPGLRPARLLSLYFGQAHHVQPARHRGRRAPPRCRGLGIPSPAPPVPGHARAHRDLRPPFRLPALDRAHGYGDDVKEALRSPWVRLVAVLVGIVLLVRALAALREVLTPFAIAFAVAYFLNPAVTALEGIFARSGRLQPRTAAVMLI